MGPRLSILPIEGRPWNCGTGAMRTSTNTLSNTSQGQLARCTLSNVYIHRAIHVARPDTALDNAPLKL
eukprot:779874-Pelagomonas_calceolata.AAC.5